MHLVAAGEVEERFRTLFNGLLVFSRFSDVVSRFVRDCVHQRV